MKDYKIHIDEDLDIKSKKILTDYWLLHNNKFVNKPTEICKTQGVSKVKLIKLVQTHSYCKINHGRCKECTQVMEEKAISQSECISLLRDKIHECSKCKAEFRTKMEQHEKDELEKRRKQKLLNFEKAVIEKKWIGLSRDEFSILSKLIENRTKKNIYANVFEGNPFDLKIWSYVDKFQNLGLIYVNRSGNSVVEFEFDERINESIRNFFVTKNTSENGIEPVTDFLSFSLSKKEFKQTIRHPDYGGTFKLEKDVVLKANTKYIYGGWIQTDGSINLKFTPLSNLQSHNTTQESLKNQPENINSIARSMFNVIHEFQTHDEVPNAFNSNFYKDEDGGYPF